MPKSPQDAVAPLHRAVPSGVGPAVVEMIESLATTAEAKESDPDDHAAAFIDDVMRRVFDWMAIGDNDGLRHFVADVHGLEEASPAAAQAFKEIRGLTPAELLVARIGTIGDFAAAYLRSNNAARHLARLSGRRKEAWRRILTESQRLDRPIRAGDLVDLGVYKENKNGSAAAALKRLTELGYLAKVGEVSSGVRAYRLTWVGRHVATALALIEARGEREATVSGVSMAAAPEPVTVLRQSQLRAAGPPQVPWVPDDDRMEKVGLRRDGLVRAATNLMAA